MSYLLVILGAMLALIATFFAGKRNQKAKQEKEKALKVAHTNEVIKDAEKISDNIDDMPINNDRINASINFAKKANSEYSADD